MKTTQNIIQRAFEKYRPVLSFSGGGDSSVLLDIVYQMGYKPTLIFADSQMEYPETVQHVKAVSLKYGLELHIAKAGLTPLECWKKHGYPMLGKMSARIWMQKHRLDNSLGFRCDVSTCCQKMKIDPARNLTKELGFNSQLTGQRGNQDDRLRGMRAHLDGAFKLVKSSNVTVINPLLGWTDLMIKRYSENHKLKQHPLKKSGALTIGCIYCGGGAQFDNSGFRVLRKTDPQAFKKMLIEYGFAEIIISIRNNCHIETARDVLNELGGIEKIIETMPHVFDFLRDTPLKGYER